MPLEREGSDPLNGGFVAGVPPHMVGAAESPDCTNSDPTDPWGMTTRQPSSFYTGAAFPASTQNSGLIRTDVYVNNINGRVYVLGASIIMWALKDGGFSSIAASAFSTVSTSRMGVIQLPPISIASMASSYFSLIVGPTIPLLFNEITVAATAASMASTGIFADWAEVFANRAFIGGRTDGTVPGNYISHSAVNDVTDWTTANNAGAFYVGGPEKVITGKATRAALYFFKRNSIWLVTGTSPLDFEVEKVTDNFGLIAPRGVVSDGQGVYFASDDGIYYVNGLNVTRISDKVRAEYLSIPDKTQIVLAYKGEKLYCFRNSSGTSANDSALVAAPRRKIETGDIQAIWAKWSSIYGGAATTGGPFADVLIAPTFSSFYVFRAESASAGSNASATLTYNSPHWDFREPEAKKQGVWWNLHVRPTSATQTWTAQLKADGASVGSSYSIDIASGASHAYVARPAKAGWVGNYLGIELSSLGQRTLYGVNAYAEVQADGDYPRTRE